MYIANRQYKRKNRQQKAKERLLANLPKAHSADKGLRMIGEIKAIERNLGSQKSRAPRFVVTPPLKDDSWR